MLTMACHFACRKLRFGRDDINWGMPLSYIFLMLFEEIYQAKEGKMITLADREAIDEGEIDRKLNEIKQRNLERIKGSIVV